LCCISGQYVPESVPQVRIKEAAQHCNFLKALKDAADISIFQARVFMYKTG
jgi:hypothetical protein